MFVVSFDCLTRDYGPKKAPKNTFLPLGSTKNMLEAFGGFLFFDIFGLFAEITFHTLFLKTLCKILLPGEV